jgi:prepilin-type N-terminal cleavage/methylation domain-containing protein
MRYVIMLKRTRNGFTLIELLVVVAIIAVLVSMLLPALAKARYSAKLLTCSTNLKSWGNYLVMYASDNKDFFPCHGKLKTHWWWPTWNNDPDAAEYGGFWSNPLPFVRLVYPTYIRRPELFFCPLDAARPPKDPLSMWWQNLGFSYSYMGSYGTDPSDFSIASRCKTLADPASAIMADQECWTPRMQWTWNHMPNVFNGFGLVPGTVTVLYTDGHTELKHVGSTWYPYFISALPN